MTKNKTACIIPTYNGLGDLQRLVSSLENQECRHDLYIVDSSSKDGTYEFACSTRATVTKISSAEFNHGGTRQMMVNANPGYDYYIFLTQDAVLNNSKSLSNLISPFDTPSVGAVYGRQLPHDDANVFAKHARYFNYPIVSDIKSIEDSRYFGIKTAFLSNSFSAYRGKALHDAGGFADHLILSEDMYVAANMLIKGWSIAYAADAECKHSHNYTMKDEFCRYFDIGVFHSREPWIREKFGGAGGEGLRFVKSELQFLGLSNFHLFPSSLIRNAAKLVAYKLGQHEKSIDVKYKKSLSMHSKYWA